MLMTLGFFVFGLPTATYQQMQRQLNWRHAEQQRIGARPVYQYLGQGADTLTLSGIIYPELAGGRLSLDSLKVMAEDGEAWPLIEGTGRYYGFWAIQNLDETASHFMQDGAPQKLDFTLQLIRVDEKKLDLNSLMLNSATSALTGIAAGPLNKVRQGTLGKIKL